MKQLALAFLAGFVLSISNGCCCTGCGECASDGCNQCIGRGSIRPGIHGPDGNQYPNGYPVGPAGPPTPTYGYPYYTTRAPRDFFMANPPSIGY